MSDWKGIISAVAPTIATMLGGPLAGAAVSALSASVLGRPDGGEADIAKAITSGGQDVLEKIVNAEKSFKLEMERLNIDYEKISQEDRKDARNREVQTQDPTTRRLAYAALLMFVAVLAAQFYTAFAGITINSEVQRTLDITLGILFAWVLAVKDYYFGSSSGSSKKTEALAKMLGQ